MCLAIPGQVLSIDEYCPVRTGEVSFDGVCQKVALCYVPDAGLGDYVLVHVGFAITKISTVDAQTQMAYLKEMFAHEIPQ